MRYLLSLIVLVFSVQCAVAKDLPDTPVAKVQPARDVKQGKLVLDRSVLVFAILQGTADLVDGISTYQFTRACRTCVESQTPWLLGKKPGWDRMIPAGMIEAGVSAYVAQKMRHSDKKALRVSSWLIQPTFIAWHFEAGIHNYFISTNSCRGLGPEFHDDGKTCTNAPIVPSVKRLHR